MAITAAILLFSGIASVALLTTATSVQGRVGRPGGNEPRLRLTTEQQTRRIASTLGPPDGAHWSRPPLLAAASHAAPPTDEHQARGAPVADHRTLAIAESRHGKCCTAKTAECLSCQAGEPLATFCLKLRGENTTGCEGFCGLNEDSYNYPGGDIHSLRVASVQQCCAACRAEPDCTSWTWGKNSDQPDYEICYLKSQSELRREEDENYISGLPGWDTREFQIRQDSFCLDISAIHQGHGLAPCVATTHHQAWLYDQTTGTIKNKQTTNKCVDLHNSAVVMQNCLVGSPSQRWVYYSDTGQMENAAGMCLSLLGAAASQSVRMVPCSAQSQHQRWVLQDSRAASPRSKARTSTSTRTVTDTGLTTTTSTSVTTTLPSTSTVERTTTTKPRVAPRAVADASLFCFSLMLPWGYEPDLLRMQIAERRSIFACEDFVVYSSVALDLGSGYTTQRVDTDLHCPLGGVYHTALNTPIFLKIWSQVIKDGRFRVHEWTVKADPDAVFMPSRLRDIVRIATLSTVVETGKGLFLNNCRFGLHGPLEVVSRRALETYGMEQGKCERPPQEDVYLQHCMLTIGVTQMNQWNLLAEAACRSPEWQSCHSAHAAFHPFKDQDAFRDCQSEAEKNGTWSRKEVVAVEATPETIGFDPSTAKLGNPVLHLHATPTAV